MIKIYQAPWPIGDIKLLKNIENIEEIEFEVVHEGPADIAIIHTCNADEVCRLIQLVSPKILIIHTCTHYSQGDLDQRDVFYNSGFYKNFSNINFVILYHNFKSKPIEVDNYKEIRYEFVYNYYRSLFIGKKIVSLFTPGNSASDPALWDTLDDKHQSISDKERIFLSPCRLYVDENRTHYRYKLWKFLKSYELLGFVSGPGRENNPGVLEKFIGYTDESYFLSSQVETPGLRVGTNDGSSRNHPINNYFYENTFISIYGETIELGAVATPTEKTYVPLWKGHLILPFSSHGFVSVLLNLGFKLPMAYINYDYDLEINDDARWNIYIREVERLINLPKSQWEIIWQETLQIRKHNIQIFQNTDFYRITQILKR